MAKIILEQLCGEYFIGEDKKVYWVKPFDENVHEKRKAQEVRERDFEAIMIAGNQAQTLIQQVNRLLEDSSLSNEERVRAASLKIAQWRRSN